MLGLDSLIAEWGAGGGIALAFLVALLLGLRHATDPDHLTAVSVLVLDERRGGPRGATRLGLAWGAGHATTLLAVGVPFVLWGKALAPQLQQAAEIAIGLLIVGLAVRLLSRRRPPGETLGRTPLAAFGIGLAHGLGGAGGAGILLIGVIERRDVAALALLVFAAATALSMWLASFAVGHLLTRPRVALRLEAAIPLLAVLALVFGAWYAFDSGSVAAKL